ncbi:NAD(P) transhydrogenase subunit alpha [soil metagenome]
MSLRIGVLHETQAGEHRVAIVPDIVSRLKGLGADVIVQKDAGVAAGIPDAAFGEASTGVAAAEILNTADVLLKVQPPTLDEVAALREGATVVGFMQPHTGDERVRALCNRRVTAFAMELVPRISRAQSMDALSSQAAVGGYKAALIAANTLDKFFPMLTTAAGTIRPAKVLVIGAGVAGLQAIATARRLGAVVEGYDVRAATREQVESLGARFVDTGVSAEGEGGYARELTGEEKGRQQEVLEKHIAEADAVITTAAVPGRPAPRIISRAAVGRMKAGSVIVDLAAESGGNCELTRAGETIESGGVRIVGPVNLPSQLARHASEMYARNLFNFLKPAIADGRFEIDWEDEVFAGSALTHEGEIRDAATRERMEAAEKGAPA